MLQVTWADQGVMMIPSELLRVHCPCASCLEARGELTHEKPLSATKKKGSLAILQSSKEEEISLEHIWPVGQYALGIRWGDGHQTGIYTYEYLHRLGTQSIQSDER